MESLINDVLYTIGILGGGFLLGVVYSQKESKTKTFEVKKKCKRCDMRTAIWPESMWSTEKTLCNTCSDSDLGLE